MSRHSDYVFRERAQQFDRAVGFGGQVEQLSNRSSVQRESDKKAFYYYGSDKSQEDQDHWLTFLAILPIAILLAFGFSPLLGFVFVFVGIIAIGFYFLRRRLH